MPYTFTTSGAAIRKAGINANSTITASGSYLVSFFDEAEGLINSATRYDWISNYSNVGANYKNILGDVCSDIVASKIINADMSGFSSKVEAQTMLDVLRDNINRALDILKEKANQDVMV